VNVELVEPKKGRRPKVPGALSNGNVHSLYCPQIDWDDLQKIAPVLGFGSASELIRDKLAPVLAEFRNGKIDKPQFDIKRKEAELALSLKELNKITKTLKDQYSGDSRISDYTKMCGYIVGLGADANLEGGLEVALEKLRKPSMNGGCPCSGATRTLFGKLLSLVIECRGLQAEIDHYYEHEGKKE